MRYLLLLILNLPIILLALVNIVTQYKLRKVSRNRFRHQLLIWTVLLVLLIVSFPAYNLAVGRPLFDSTELSIFDILQTTAIIFLVYISNAQRHQIEQNERRLRDLHEELSITLSETASRD